MPRIAVVDSDPDFLQFMRDLLQDGEWDMMPYPETTGTFVRLRTDQPDLVLLDVGPSATTASWGILRRLQADSATQHIPILVCSTGQAHLSHQERQLLGPSVTLLPKPFDIDALYRAMDEARRRHLPRRPGPDGTEASSARPPT
jgi:CheY-like chemotaxis protein